MNRPKLLVTGIKGLVGNAIKHINDIDNKFDLIGIGHEIDLCKESEVIELYRRVKPEYVIHCAAMVGTLSTNLKHQAEFFRSNVLMNTNIIHNAWLNDVKRVISFGSTSAFPVMLKNVDESMLHLGDVSKEYYGYAQAKRHLDVQNSVYNSQYGTNYITVFPGTIFGLYDNFNDPNKSRMIPALINRIYTSKAENKDLIVWGNGSAVRELIYSLDLARAVFELIERPKLPERLLVCSDVELSVKQIVEKLIKISDFKNQVVWDTTKPNGSFYMKSNTALMKSILPDFKFTDIDTALKETYEFFIESNNET